MSDPQILGTPLEQTELEIGSKSQERSLLDELLSKSKLYKSSTDFKARLYAKSISVELVDQGDRSAGMKWRD